MVHTIAAISGLCRGWVPPKAVTLKSLLVAALQSVAAHPFAAVAISVALRSGIPKLFAVPAYHGAVTRP